MLGMLNTLPAFGSALGTLLFYRVFSLFIEIGEVLEANIDLADRLNISDFSSSTAETCPLHFVLLTFVSVNLLPKQSLQFFEQNQYKIVPL